MAIREDSVKIPVGYMDLTAWCPGILTGLITASHAAVKNHGADRGLLRRITRMRASLESKNPNQSHNLTGMMVLVMLKEDSRDKLARQMMPISVVGLLLAVRGTGSRTMLNLHVLEHQLRVNIEALARIR